MENIGVSLYTVEIDDTNIKVTYENGNIENLAINIDTYKNMFNTWLKDLPPFISDKHKNEMRSIILVSTTNNENELVKLKEFFSISNSDNVKAFFTYMRERKALLNVEKKKWTI